MFAPLEFDSDVDYFEACRKLVYFVSPITRLTADVLNLIFLEVKRSEIFYRSCKAAPILSHVCRFWRDVAIESPLLWNTVYMHCVRTPQDHSWVVAHMRRSKKCMVDLHLFATRTVATHEVEYMFVRHGDRIRSLTVHGSNPLLTRLLWRQLHGNLPSLESYQFVANRGIDLHATRDVPIKKEERFPFPFPLILRDNDLSWAEWNATGLTMLVLKWIYSADRLPLDDLRTIISTCQPTLRHFEYVGISPYSVRGADITPITVPALETLTLAYADSFVPLAKLLHAPNLKSLSLRDLFNSPDFKRPFAKLSLQNSQPTDLSAVFELYDNIQLNEFSISGERYSQSHEALRSFLFSQSKLKSLSIYGCSGLYCDHVFDIGVDPKDMLPSLTHLHVVCDYDIAEKVLNFLRRRKERKLAPLDKLTVAKNSETFVILKRELFIEVAKAISVVSDPVWQLHVPFDEKTIIVDGNLLLLQMT
ncbi:hypothetical protein C0991_009349 [Blastosporella zonata]|nr:hypothetical protein C0991_009349 [Blastosporella zonata]